MTAAPGQIRPARRGDAEALVAFVRATGEGGPDIVPAVVAGPGESPRDVGTARARREGGGFSDRNARIPAGQGQALASLVGYPLPDAPVETGAERPGFAATLKALAGTEDALGHASRLLAHAGETARLPFPLDGRVTRSCCAGRS